MNTNLQLSSDPISSSMADSTQGRPRAPSLTLSNVEAAVKALKTFQRKAREIDAATKRVSGADDSLPTTVILQELDEWESQYNATHDDLKRIRAERNAVDAEVDLVDTQISNITARRIQLEQLAATVPAVPGLIAQTWAEMALASLKSLDTVRAISPEHRALLLNEELELYKAQNPQATFDVLYEHLHKNLEKTKPETDALREQLSAQNNIIQALEADLQTARDAKAEWERKAGLQEGRITALTGEVEALRIDLESVVATDEDRKLLRMMTTADDEATPADSSVSTDSWTVEPSWLPGSTPEGPGPTSVASTLRHMVLQLQSLLLDHSYEAALAVTAHLVRDVQQRRSPGDVASLRAALDTLWAAATITQQPLVVFAVHELGVTIGVELDDMVVDINCPLLSRLVAALKQSRRREDLVALLLQSKAREHFMAPPVILPDAETAWIGDDQTSCFLMLDLKNRTVTSIHRSLGRMAEVPGPGFAWDRMVTCPMDRGRSIKLPRNIHPEFLDWWTEYVASWEETISSIHV